MGRPTLPADQGTEIVTEAITTGMHCILISGHTSGYLKETNLLQTSEIVKMYQYLLKA
jgi:hypothetical protein